MIATRTALKQLRQLFLQAGMSHQGGALSAAFGTHTPEKRGGMLNQAATAAISAVAGQGDAVPLLQLRRLLLPACILAIWCALGAHRC